jgi:hypothetical protein
MEITTSKITISNRYFSLLLLECPNKKRVAGAEFATQGVYLTFIKNVLTGRVSAPSHAAKQDTDDECGIKL